MDFDMFITQMILYMCLENPVKKGYEKLSKASVFFVFFLSQAILFWGIDFIIPYRTLTIYNCWWGSESMQRSMFKKWFSENVLLFRFYLYPKITTLSHLQNFRKIKPFKNISYSIRRNIFYLFFVCVWVYLLFYPFLYTFCVYAHFLILGVYIRIACVIHIVL